MATTASPVVQIRDYLNWHTNLYAILDETASAPANLTQHNAFIKDLEEKVSDVATRIGKLESAREKEFKEHESYRDSNFKKLAYKVGGRKDKFELRKEKEEQEYYEVSHSTHTSTRRAMIKKGTNCAESSTSPRSAGRAGKCPALT